MSVCVCTDVRVCICAFVRNKTCYIMQFISSAIWLTPEINGAHTPWIGC